MAKKGAKVLVVGGGGREHALAEKLAQSDHVGIVYVAPGNGGTAIGTKMKNVPIVSDNLGDLAVFAVDHGIDLTVVGPEAPLVTGIVDYFRPLDLRIFGASKGVARLEGLKGYAKRFMKDHDIPTAPFQTFTKHDEAVQYVLSHETPIVVKASGLAGGKGVYVCQTVTEALTALWAVMVDRVRGGAGCEVVIEKYLQGPERSFHALCDGRTALKWPDSCDVKFFNGGQTGGMGGYIPLPSNVVLKYQLSTIIQKIMAGLEREGHRARGCFYPNLMLTADGPQVLEINCRLGDPETQMLMWLLKSDLYEVFEACVEGRLSDVQLEWHSGYVAGVVMASGGYPGPYETGKLITGIESVKQIPGAQVFHAGTALRDGLFYTGGGRVCTITARGPTPDEAEKRAYEAVGCIHFEGMNYPMNVVQ